MVSSKADGRKNPIGLFVLFLAYGWSKIECEVRICQIDYTAEIRFKLWR